MRIAALRLSFMVLAAVVLTGDRAFGMGEILGETKEQLKLKYDLTVQEHIFDGASTERVTIVFTLADEGRLKPLDDVQLVIPGKEKNKDGGRWMDLVVAIELRKSDDGKRVGRVHIRKELAERAEIWLNTHSMDGKELVMERLTHIVPVAKYMKNAPPRAAAAKSGAAPTAGPPPPASAAPPAAEQKKD